MRRANPVRPDAILVKLGYSLCRSVRILIPRNFKAKRDQISELAAERLRNVGVAGGVSEISSRISNEPNSAPGRPIIAVSRGE